MQTRDIARTKWVKSILGATPFHIKPLAGDASFRRYFRLYCENSTHVIMDAPPSLEEVTTFVEIAKILANHGVHTPTIYAADYDQGFLLLEDFGDALLLGIIQDKNADALYTQAMNTLHLIQATPITTPIFDKEFMLKELSLFSEWFLQKYLLLTLNANDTHLLQTTFDTLVTQISKQPQVFIHRDYHSRNLIRIEPGITSVSGAKLNIILTQETEVISGSILSYENKLGVIDFQDAMLGPHAYDIASLLKDCYIQWPHEKLLTWLAEFHSNLPQNTRGTLQEFLHAFEYCGLQRHLKVLGVFCRLHLRDNKSGYLRDLPLTFNYVMTCLEMRAEFGPFYQFMQQIVQPAFLNKLS